MGATRGSGTTASTEWQGGTVPVLWRGRARLGLQQIAKHTMHCWRLAALQDGSRAQQHLARRPQQQQAKLGGAGAAARCLAGKLVQCLL